MIADLERAVHLVAVLLARTTDELGITQAEVHVLAQLAREGPQTIAELQRGFGHKPSTLTSILDRLDEKGLIERATNPGDRRSFVVTPTRDGARVARRASAAIARIEAEVARSVTRRDIEGLRGVADALAQLV